MSRTRKIAVALLVAVAVALPAALPGTAVASPSPHTVTGVATTGPDTLWLWANETWTPGIAYGFAVLNGTPMILGCAIVAHVGAIHELYALGRGLGSGLNTLYYLRVVEGTPDSFGVTAVAGGGPGVGGICDAEFQPVTAVIGGAYAF